MYVCVHAVRSVLSRPWKRAAADRVSGGGVRATDGTHDWMDATSAAEVIDERADKSVPMKLVTIPRAGHNLFLDNPQAFIHQLMGSLMQTPAMWQRDAALNSSLEQQTANVGAAAASAVAPRTATAATQPPVAASILHA